MEKVVMGFSRSEVFTLFAPLLMSEKSIFTKQNRESQELLKRLWVEVADRTKVEMLWNPVYREKLDSWSIPYKADLERLEIPEVLEEDDE